MADTFKTDVAKATLELQLAHDNMASAMAALVTAENSASVVEARATIKAALTGPRADLVAARDRRDAAVAAMRVVLAADLAMPLAKPEEHWTTPPVAAKPVIGQPWPKAA